MPSDDEFDENDDDVRAEDDVEDERCRDLIDPDRVMHASATLALVRAREDHGVDARAAAGGRAASEAFYDVFKWLNYVRRTVRTMREADAGVSASALAEACRSGTASRAWDDDSYMTPEDADDAALFGFEAYVDGRDDDGDDDGFGDDGDVDGLTTDLERRLTMENEELRLRILEVMSNAGLVNEASVEAAFSPVVAEGTASSDAGNETSGGVAPSSSSAMRATSGGAGASRRRVPETPEERLAREVDDGYFDSYSYLTFTAT